MAADPALSDRLADFYARFCPDKACNIPAMVEKYAAVPDVLMRTLETKYSAPGYFARQLLDLTSPFLDPLACLYEPGVVVPVASVVPLDNVAKCRQLVCGLLRCRGAVTCVPNDRGEGDGR
jgi:hypothetical protein